MANVNKQSLREEFDTLKSPRINQNVTIRGGSRMTACNRHFRPRQYAVGNTRAVGAAIGQYLVNRRILGRLALRLRIGY